MRAFSAIKLLFCSLLAELVLVPGTEGGAETAAAAAAAAAEAASLAAANSVELRNKKAAVDGSKREGCGGPGGPKPIKPKGGGIMPDPGGPPDMPE